jgi:hypothetical protein
VDSPRLLRRRSEYGGYTTDPSRALFDEPEAVGAEVQELLTDRARRVELDSQREEWREHRDEIERRLGWLQSQRFRRDVSSQVRALRRQLDRLDELIGQPGRGAA